MAEKLWHWGALNRTSNGQKAGGMGTHSPVHAPANAAPARDPHELHHDVETHTLTKNIYMLYKTKDNVWKIRLVGPIYFSPCNKKNERSGLPLSFSPNCFE